MNEQNKIKLTWKDNTLYIGKICIGAIIESERSWFWYYPCSFVDRLGFSDDLFAASTESEARTALETFVRSQTESGGEGV